MSRGLAICPFMPASLASFKSFLNTLAVMAIIGRFALTGSSRLLMALVASYPFMTGICTSIRIKSYKDAGDSLMILTASCPSTAVSMIKPTSLRIVAAISLLSSLSSTRRRRLSLNMLTSYEAGSFSLTADSITAYL